MRILVGWDDVSQAELISLYLNVGENQVDVTTDKDHFLEQAHSGRRWDIVLMSTNLPDVEGAFEAFQAIRKKHPECPIVGACDPQDVFRMAQFLTAGMRSYIPRDKSGDFVFLLQATLENVVESVQAEREQKLAERLREEIESVRKLQESVIPHNLECPAGYDICARYEPSQIQVIGGRPVVMAGGDYYDVFSLDEKNVVVLVGDASGHGMKACMSIMTMHTLVRMIRNQSYQDTATFVKEINLRLCEQSVVNNEGGFITLLYGILNTETHEFQWSAAGHSPPLLQSLEDDRIEELGPEDAGGLPLGIYPDVDYESYRSYFPPRSRLLLYTDGLIEAFPENSDEHNEYGVEGVVDLLKKSQKLPLSQTLQALFDDSHAFTQGGGRHDDTSVVLLEHF